MKPQRVVAVVLWLWFLGGVLWQAFTPIPPMLEHGWRWDALGFAVAGLPLIFFATAPLWQNGHPLDVPTLRKRVDRRFGPTTYESYIRAVKPLFLFAVSGAALGIIHLLSAVYRGAPEGAYVIAVFFLSGSAGMLIARGLLRGKIGALE